MLDMDKINEELRNLAKAKGHTFEYDQNTGRYNITYWNSSMDRVSEEVDFQAVEILDHDELVTYLLQIIMKTRERQKIGRDIMIEMLVPTIILASVAGVLITFNLPILPVEISFLYLALAIGLVLFLFYRRKNMKAIHKADLATYTIRQDLVDVLNKLAMHSTNPSAALRYKKRANRLARHVL